MKKLIMGGLLVFSLSANAKECPKVGNLSWQAGYVAGYVAIREQGDDDGFAKVICTNGNGIDVDDCWIGYYEALEDKALTLKCVGKDKILKPVPTPEGD